MQNTIILTVHNKENSIIKVLHNLFSTISSHSKKLIIILDGCTDNTMLNIKKYFLNNQNNLVVDIIPANDIWETKANNVGLRMVETEYATILQDDMLIMHKNWDKILIEKLKQNSVFSVSGRAAYDFNFKNDKFNVENIIGREYPFGSKNLFGKIVGKIMFMTKAYWIYKYFSFFSIRKVNNRGPLMFKVKLLRELNYFDEKFAPFELDDVDLCCRAYKKFGLYSGCYPIFYKEINGSKKNNLNSSLMSKKSIVKNTKLLMQRHSDLLI